MKSAPYKPRLLIVIALVLAAGNALAESVVQRSESHNKSATSVHYTGKRCFQTEERKKVANDKRPWTESEKQMLAMWLTVAEGECERVRAEPSPVASAVSTPS